MREVPALWQTGSWDGRGDWGSGTHKGPGDMAKVTSVVPSDPQNALWFYLLLLKGIPVTTKI